MAPKFWRASVETRNFHFEAYGATRAAAVRTLRYGWLEHERVTQAFMKWSELAEDVSVAQVELGAAYRDGELILRFGGRR